MNTNLLYNAMTDPSSLSFVPEATTLSWLLRQVSLRIVHTRRSYRAEKEGYRKTAYGNIWNEYENARDYIADVIRDQENSQ